MHKPWVNSECNKFVLTPASDQSDPNQPKDQFFIEMPYGDIRPKLTTYDRNFNLKSDITCSAKPNIPDELSIWYIKIAE